MIVHISISHMALQCSISRDLHVYFKQINLRTRMSSLFLCEISQNKVKALRPKLCTMVRIIWANRQYFPKNGKKYTVHAHIGEKLLFPVFGLNLCINPTIPRCALIVHLPIFSFSLVYMEI